MFNCFTLQIFVLTAIQNFNSFSQSFNNIENIQIIIALFGDFTLITWISSSILASSRNFIISSIILKFPNFNFSVVISNSWKPRCQFIIFSLSWFMRLEWHFLSLLFVFLETFLWFFYWNTVFRTVSSLLLIIFCFFHVFIIFSSFDSPVLSFTFICFIFAAFSLSQLRCNRNKNVKTIFWLLKIVPFSLLIIVYFLYKKSD